MRLMKRPCTDARFVAPNATGPYCSHMPSPTVFTCPECNQDFTVGRTRFHDIGAVGTGGTFPLMLIRCTHCGHEFDPLPEDGVYTTVAGRWSRVASYVQAASAETLRALQLDLETAVSARDTATAQLALQKAGMASAAGQSLTEQRLWSLVMVLLGILAVVVPLKLAQPEGVSPEQIEDLIEHVQEQKEPGRNEPCWCGNGVKYKRCHGAHPSTRKHDQSGDQSQLDANEHRSDGSANAN